MLIYHFDHLITIFIATLLSKKGGQKYGHIFGLMTRVANLGGLQT